MAMLLKGVKDRIDVKVVAVVEVDNGEDIKVPFVVTYKKPTIKERQETARQVNEGQKDDLDVVREYVLGWSEIPTTTGDPYPFTPENLDEMLQQREYQDALVQGYREVAYGRKAVLIKNS